MSAFLVSEKHILTLAFYYDYMANGSYRNPKLEDIDHERLNSIAKILWRENHKSFNYRYNEKNRLKFSPVGTVHPVIDLSLEELVKQIYCWDYQSCEHPTHNNSKAYKMMQDLQCHILYRLVKSEQHLAKYDAAKWGI